MRRVSGKFHLLQSFNPMPVLRILLLIIALYSSMAIAVIEVGQTAPHIEGTLINGKPFSLGANKGKVILVNFWASWCEPCKEEMPLIEAYLKKNKAKGFEVLAITMDKPSDLEQANKIMENYSFLSANKKNTSTFLNTAEYGAYQALSLSISRAS